MNILLVEDHADTRSMMERLLGQWKHEVTSVEDVAGGLHCLKSKTFDAIISDIALPDGTGYELMWNARHWGIYTLSIAISAYPYPRGVEEPDVTGFDYHFNKPLPIDELRRVLEECDPTGREAAATTR